MIKKNLLKRIATSVIDYLLFFGLCYVYLMYFGEYERGMYKVSGSGTFPVILMWFIYFCVIEGTQGGTLGHLMMGLQVIKLKNEPVSIGTAFKRHIADPLDIYVWGLVGLVTIWFTEKHQRIGDLIAKTIVIDTGDPEQLTLRKSNHLQNT